MLRRDCANRSAVDRGVRIRARRCTAMVAMRDVRIPDERSGRGTAVTPSPKLVVLDLAGATVKDSGHVATAFLTALAEQEIRVIDDQLAAVRGASKREAIARLIPGGPEHARRANDAYESFRQHLRK